MKTLTCINIQRAPTGRKSYMVHPPGRNNTISALTGGNDKTKFALNFTNNKEARLIPTSSYTRNYINFKLNHEVSQSIKIDASMRYTHPVTNGAGSAGSANFRVGDGITTRPVNGIADMIILDQGASEEYEQFLANMINPVQLTQQDYRKNQPCIQL